MDGTRKRSTATRFRGDSPPFKRRQAEQPSATDRRNSYRDAVNGPESFQNGGRQEASRNLTARNSPLHVMSPMSNHSGSSTPVQAAPVVPSMVPAAQKATASQSASMDVLDALRSRKASLAVSIAEASGGVTIQEMNLLKAKLKAAELRENQYRSECKILDSRLKQLESLPAQLAELKDQMEQQQQTAAKRSSLEAVEKRPSALENAKSPVAATQFEEMQSHVHGLKLETKKLNEIPERLVSLQATVSQQGQDIAKALSRNEDMDKTLQLVQATANDLTALDFRARVADLEERIGRIDKNDDLLENEHDRLANRTQHVSPLDSNELREIVIGIDEDNEKLAKDLQNVRVASGQPQPQDKVDADAGVQPSLSAKEVANLSERIARIEQEVSANHSKVNMDRELLDRLRQDMQVQQDATSNQIKTFEVKQMKLVNECTMVVERLNVFEDAQAKLSKGHDTITTSFETLKATLQQEHNKVIRLVNEYHEEQISLSGQQKVFQAQHDSLLEEQTNLKATSQSLESSVKASDKEVEHLSKTQMELMITSQSLESRFTAFEKTVSQVRNLVTTQTDLSNAQRHLGRRVTALEMDPLPAADQGQLVGRDALVSSSRFDNLETKLRSVETNISGISGLSARVDQLETNVEEIVKDIDHYEDKMDKLKEGIISMFEDIFDPFKTWVEERNDEWVSSLTRVNETLVILQVKVEASQKECPATDFSDSHLILLENTAQRVVEAKQELDRLQDSVRSETDQRVTAVEDLYQQLATKQDSAAANSLIDTIRHSLRALKSQYENIVSDDLHQKMTHWFMQSYGHPTANMLKHIPDINLRLQEMQSLTDVFTRIPNSAQALGTLAQLEPQLKSLAKIVPQLTVLAQSPPTSGGSHELSAKTAESSKTMEDQLAKVVQEHSNLTQVVKGLQGSLHSLNKIPLAKADSLNAVEKSIVSLQAELKACIEEGMQACGELETKAGNDHKERVESEKSIKSSIESVSNSVGELSKRMDEEVKERETADGELLSVSKNMVDGCVKAQQKTSDTLEIVQITLGQLRSDLDEALSDFNDPKNKEALACLPTLFLHVGQLQWVLEELNKNMPRGGLEIEWHNDFKEKWPIPSPFVDANAAPVTPKGKGKGKRQT